MTRKRLTAAFGAALLVAATAACGGGDDDGADGGPITPDAEPGVEADAGPEPDAGPEFDAGPQILTIEEVTTGGAFEGPMDSTPDPDGAMIYFTARSTTEGESGVFKVAASGGTATAVRIGEPFVAPLGIAISTDGSTLYIADPGAGDAGEIFSMDTTGGTPEVLAGATGLRARGLTIVSDGTDDMMYFTGAEDGVPGVYMMGTDGNVDVHFSGGLLVDPSGVTADAEGNVYVTDSGSGTSGRVLMVTGSDATVLTEGLHLGYPSGLAFKTDSYEMFVSATDGRGQNLSVELTIDGVLESSTPDEFAGAGEAGGLHRAHNTDVFSFCDGTVEGKGTVYVLHY